MGSHGLALVALLAILARIPLALGDVIAPLGDNFIIASPGPDAIGGRPGVASNGVDFLVGWTPPGGTTVDYARISADGAILATAAIATGAGAHVPSIAFGASQYLLVWAQNSEVKAVRVTSAGALIDPVPLTLTSGGDVKTRPITIAFDGTNYLVAWRTNGDVIRGKRFDASGAALDAPAGFVIGTGFYPWAAAGGGTFAVTWHAHGPSGLDIFAARVSPQGSVADPGGFVVANLPSDQDHSSIAFGGGTFFIAWHDWRNTDDYGNGETHGARLAPDGTLSAPLRISDMTLWQVPVQVVFDGTDFFVAWHADNPSKFRAADSYGRRVSTSGTLLEEQPVPIGTAYWHQWGPVLGFGNDRILAAWSDRRNGSACAAGCVQGQVLERRSVPPSPSVVGGSVSEGTPTWSVEASPASSHLYTVTAADDDAVYASGEGPIIRRQSGTWQTFHSTGQRMYGSWTGGGTRSPHVRFLGQCWAAAHFDGTAWEPQFCHGFGNPDPAQFGLGIWGHGTDFAMTVGTEGVWQRFNGIFSIDGRFGTNATMHDVWGVSPTHIYAVGEFGKVFRYDGAAWTPEPGVPTMQSLNAIWGSGPSDVFAVGDFGTVVHFDGTTWTTQPTPTSAHLLGISGTAPNNVYAVGSRGAILHYNGVQWTAQVSGTDKWLFDVAAVNWKAWAVGESGLILRKEIPGGAAGDEDGDGIPNGIESGEGRNAFLKDNDVFANARLFAMQQYRDFLNREGDSGGITFWTSQIQTGAHSRAQCVESFFNSAEFQGTVAPVVRLYFAYFLRVPDYGGLQFWIDFYKAGNSLDSVSNNFAASPEFQARYGALSNSQYVTLVYNNVLGRAPDTEGLNFWVNQLDTGQRTRGQVMLGFSESAEYRAASFVDVYVTMMYVGMLRRSPDDGGFDFWTGKMDAGNSGLALIGEFLASVEYRGRFLP